MTIRPVLHFIVALALCSTASIAAAQTKLLRFPDICNDRVVFNVGGNKYRFVVELQYQAGIVWVKFVGTHVQYDRIDVEAVNDY